MMITEELITSNINRIRSMAKKYETELVEADDLFQIGCVALIEASDTYHETYRTDKKMYLYKSVRTAMLNAVAKENKERRQIERKDDVCDDVCTEVLQKELKKILKDSINAHLRTRDKKILIEYFVNEKSMSAIAREFNLSPTCIQQRIGRSLRLMRCTKEKKQLLDYLYE